ncbi:MAG: F0F1 ATP synthase subunit A [Leptospiraceae bacterium]|nr:F0F1 ATP synthase subunit A [Leptospiraceae bacterium]MCP5498600.1 F0F1 ATP synthase subunit A [Leptospiraceae bacterium]
MNSRTKILIAIVFSLFSFSSALYASGGEDKPFNLSEVIDHHLLDHANFPFNIGGKIVYEGESGFDKGNHAIFEDHNTHKKFHYVGGLDMHITKRVSMMWIVAFLMMLIFIPASRKIAANPYRVSSRFTGMVEVFVNYLRKDVIDPNMHGHGKPYYSYLFTLFFFILFSNLLGLVPPLGEILSGGNHHSLLAMVWNGMTVTGDISVTAALASLTFLLIFVTGFAYQKVSYLWGVVPNGVPFLLYPLLWPLEFLVSPLAKCFALTIRLLANMTAGHVVILALLGFIFQYMNYGVAAISVLGAVAINFLELLVAFLQAYIFTLLTSLFVGSAMHRH